MLSLLPAGLLALLGLGVLVAALRPDRTVWRTVPGVVVACRIEPGPVDLWLALRYEYELGGLRLEGTRLHEHGASTDSAQQAERWARELPVGRAVTVHYVADDPSRVCLRPTDRTAQRRGLLPLAVLLLAIAALVLAV